MHLFNSRSTAVAVAAPVALILSLAAANVGVAMGAQETTSAGTTPPAATATPEEWDALMNEGAEVYGIDCMECHADGGVAPVLAGLTSLSKKDRVITWILQGVPDGSMPAFGPTLTDRQIAAVATYVRNYWDNAYGVVLELDVKRLRAEVDGRK
jgi:mono/diheme cytochrome c family protein